MLFGNACPSERTRKKPTSCPYCAGKKPSKDYNLQIKFPTIAKEWHPKKNRDLTPKDVSFLLDFYKSDFKFLNNMKSNLYP